MSTPEEHLAELLDARDSRIEKLEGENQDLHQQLAGSASGWCLPRIVDDVPELPLPRLELEARRKSEWCIVYEYRLVVQHLVDGVQVIPLGRTERKGGPYVADPDPTDLPYRDGAHAHHDAAHLKLPFYAVGPAGVTRLDGHEHYSHQRRLGEEHRRASDG